MSDYLILQKQVDKSVLKEGMSIPVAFQEIFYEKLGFRLKPGEKRDIRIMIDSDVYSAVLKNNNFSRERFAGHTDVLQIRYSPNSPLAMKLRSIFAATQKRVDEFYANRTGRGQLTIEKDQREYLVLYATPVKGDLYMECIPRNEYQEAAQEILKENEFVYEAGIDTDAGIILRDGVRKIRKLSKGIGDKLKIVYDYRCQICGRKIGDPYGSNLIHAHHIDYFTKSLNNNSDNILIVCPNHHGVIHDRNPEFDRNNLLYTYPNGYKEGLKINRHL